ncbi:MAG: pentapeptide repeat-containing protein [Chloroflexi bacterium]|nr:pentapeptide repeat-containing protein [Chloroflexota bacterium]
MNQINWFQAIIDLLQAIISGIFVGVVIYWLDERRALRDRRLSDFRLASNWFRSESKISLRNFDLTGTNLAGHKFIKANLEDALFVNADVWETDFSEANLRGANFTNAQLIGTKLIRATVRGAKFSKAKILKKESLDNEHLPDFTGADFQRCTFIGAQLGNALMMDSILIDTDFSNAIVMNCDFTNANLTGSKWKKARRVENCIWKGVKFDNQENFPEHLWKEIKEQNIKPVKKVRNAK